MDSYTEQRVAIATFFVAWAACFVLAYILTYRSLRKRGIALTWRTYATDLAFLGFFAGSVIGAGADLHLLSLPPHMHHLIVVPLTYSCLAFFFVNRDAGGPMMEKRYQDRTI